MKMRELIGLILVERTIFAIRRLRHRLGEGNRAILIREQAHAIEPAKHTVCVGSLGKFLPLFDQLQGAPRRLRRDLQSG